MDRAWAPGEPANGGGARGRWRGPGALLPHVIAGIGPARLWLILGHSHCVIPSSHYRGRSGNSQSGMCTRAVERIVRRCPNSFDLLDSKPDSLVAHSTFSLSPFYSAYSLLLLTIETFPISAEDGRRPRNPRFWSTSLYLYKQASASRPRSTRESLPLPEASPSCRIAVKAKELSQPFHLMSKPRARPCGYRGGYTGNNRPQSSARLGGTRVSALCEGHGQRASQSP